MCSTKSMLLLAIYVLLSATSCTKINPQTYGESICQYPDCNPQLTPPSTYQPYSAPPPPKPTSPPPPAPTGYPPYSATPPPPAGYPYNYPPGPPSPDVQSDSPPSPPPNPYTYLNNTWTSASPPPALPSVLNLCSDICTVLINILFLFAALLCV